jgi:hypothetical protein
MSIFQISKIQIRRGQAGQGTGVPVLASGELAWAIDTQELWIGNGSESEGSPNPRQNSKIFTSNDNIFEYTKYIYEQNLIDFAPNAYIRTGRAITYPTSLNVQDILDRVVYAENFGVKPPLRTDTAVDPGDVEVYPGVTLNTEAIQRAINELYLNPTLVNLSSIAYLDYGRPKHDFRVELRFTPGIYNISRTIYLPSYASITGAGIDKTIFNFTGTGPVFATINDSAFPISTDPADRTYIYEDQDPDRLVDPTTYVIPYELDAIPTPTSQPKSISLKDFTIRIQSPSDDPTLSVTALKLDSLIDSNIENVKISGQWDQLVNSGVHHYGIEITGHSSQVTSKHNVFKNVEVHNARTGVTSKFDIFENTFDNCVFKDLEYGIQFGVGTNTAVEGQFHGPRKNTISDSTFTNISKHGIVIDTGYGNKSRSNRFELVGNNGFDNTQGQYPHIKLCPHNSTLYDTFDRFELLSSSRNYNYITEVDSTAYPQALTTYKKDVNRTNGIVDLVRVPLVNTTGYKITYIYESTSYVPMVRRGELTAVIDKVNDTVQLVDSYEFSGNETASENFEFFAEILNEPANKSLIIKFHNNSPYDTATLTFTYEVLI